MGVPNSLLMSTCFSLTLAPYSMNVRMYACMCVCIYACMYACIGPFYREWNQQLWCIKRQVRQRVDSRRNDVLTTVNALPTAHVTHLNEYIYMYIRTWTYI